MNSAYEMLVRFGDEADSAYRRGLAKYSNYPSLRVDTQITTPYPSQAAMQAIIT